VEGTEVVMQSKPNNPRDNLRKAAPMLICVFIGLVAGTWIGIVSGLPSLGIAIGVAAGAILGRTLNQLRKPPGG
jgi:hypothetical protein